MKREKIIAEMKAIFGTVKFHPELIYELIELIKQGMKQNSSNYSRNVYRN